MPNFWTLVWGPPAFRRFSAEIRFAEMRRGRISLFSPRRDCFPPQPQRYRVPHNKCVSAWFFPTTFLGVAPWPHVFSPMQSLISQSSIVFIVVGVLLHVDNVHRSSPLYFGVAALHGENDRIRIRRGMRGKPSKGAHS